MNNTLSCNVASNRKLKKYKSLQIRNYSLHPIEFALFFILVRPT